MEVLKEVVRVKVEKEGNIQKKSYGLEEIEILKNKKRREKEDDVNFKELKALEEGFKRGEEF